MNIRSFLIFFSGLALGIAALLFFKSEQIISNIAEDPNHVQISFPMNITEGFPTTSTVVLSPSKDKIVFTGFDHNELGIYLANPDGTRVKKIAEQDVPEGSGALLPDSIAWTDDGTTITYVEDSVTCQNDCQNLEDFQAKRTTYSVNLETYEITIVSEQTQ